MDHIAIMRKSWGLIPKILSGEKTIETRWYKNKSAPWGKIQKGDTVYFKNSGEAITAKAVVRDVLQFEDLSLLKINELRKKYEKEIGLTSDDLRGFEDFFIGKKYGILIFLQNPKKVEPFHINKNGFGIGAAWITVPSIDMVRI